MQKKERGAKVVRWPKGLQSVWLLCVDITIHTQQPDEMKSFRLTHIFRSPEKVNFQPNWISPFSYFARQNVSSELYLLLLQHTTCTLLARPRTAQLTFSPSREGFQPERRSPDHQSRSQSARPGVRRRGAVRPRRSMYTSDTWRQEAESVVSDRMALPAGGGRSQVRI